MKSDQELRETYKLTVEDGRLIVIIFSEAEQDVDDNGRQAELVVADIRKVVEEDTTKNYSFLIDLTKAGSIHFISEKARKAYENLATFTTLSKAAVVGRSLFLEVTVNLILQAVGRAQNFKWFEDIDQARKWLEESKKEK